MNINAAKDQFAKVTALSDAEKTSIDTHFVKQIADAIALAKRSVALTMPGENAKHNAMMIYGRLYLMALGYDVSEISYHQSYSSITVSGWAD